MTMISRSNAADKYVPGSVQHFIASECDACDRVKPRTTQVVMVNPSEHYVVPTNGESRVFVTERFGVAVAGSTSALIEVEWGGKRHSFDRITGKCAETVDGLLRGWELHPFEITKNKDITANNYGEGGCAPIDRVPTTHPQDTLPGPSKLAAGQRWRRRDTGIVWTIMDVDPIGESVRIADATGVDTRLSRFDMQARGSNWSYLGGCAAAVGVAFQASSLPS